MCVIVNKGTYLNTEYSRLVSYRRKFDAELAAIRRLKELQLRGVALAGSAPGLELHNVVQSTQSLHTHANHI